MPSPPAAPLRGTETAAELRRQNDDAERRAIEAALAGISDAAQHLAQRQRQLLDELQRAAIELAVAIAARVSFEKIEADRFAVEELARSIVGRIPGDVSVRLRLNPADLALLERRLAGQPLAGDRHVQCLADAALPRGACVADSDDLNVSAQLETQLHGIRQHLLRNLANAQVERRKPLPGDRDLRRYPDRRETA